MYRSGIIREEEIEVYKDRKGDTVKETQLWKKN